MATIVDVYVDLMEKTVTVDGNLFHPGEEFSSGSSMGTWVVMNTVRKGLHIVRLSANGRFKYAVIPDHSGAYRMGPDFGHPLITDEIIKEKEIRRFFCPKGKDEYNWQRYYKSLPVVPMVSFSEAKDYKFSRIEILENSSFLVAIIFQYSTHCGEEIYRTNTKVVLKKDSLEGELEYVYLEPDRYGHAYSFSVVDCRFVDEPQAISKEMAEDVRGLAKLLIQRTGLAMGLHVGCEPMILPYQFMVKEIKGSPWGLKGRASVTSIIVEENGAEFHVTAAADIASDYERDQRGLSSDSFEKIKLSRSRGEFKNTIEEMGGCLFNDPFPFLSKFIPQ